MNLKKFIIQKNLKKKLFTPGPGSLILENITDLEPCFGRGDLQYKKIENKVLNKLKKISKHKYIARLQGSASLALEIMISNFVYGKILIIKTGIYSDRLNMMAKQAKKNFNYIKNINYVHWKEINKINDKYDWVISCVTETSMGFKIPIFDLNKLKIRTKSKLALDATASIGLEDNHHYADIMGYSSCKGLFGLTGAAFVVFNNLPSNFIDSFYLNIENHLEKKMTGPYHAICSLNSVLDNYEKFKFSVIKNKKVFLKMLNNNIIYEDRYQPLLCTYSKKKIISKNNNVVLYKTRSKIKGSILCHLGEVHLGKKSKGNILKNIKLINE